MAAMAEQKRKPPKLPPKSTPSAPPAQKSSPAASKSSTSAQTNSNGATGKTATVRTKEPDKLPPKEAKDKTTFSTPRKPSTATNQKPNPVTKRPPIKPSNSQVQNSQSQITQHQTQVKKSETPSPKRSLSNNAPKLQSTSRKPSVTPETSSVTKPPLPPKSSSPKSKDDGNVKAAHEHEEKRDLKSFLSESQCADLTILIVNITSQMRRSIEKTFEATSGLKLIGQEDSGEDNFANLDYDPATVDVSEYDKERKIRDEQEKELSSTGMKDMKKESLNWFDEWREVVVQRVGEVVNSKEMASQQKAGANSGGNLVEPQSVSKQQQVQKINASAKSGGDSTLKLEDLFPRVKTPLTKLSMAKRALLLHSILLLLLSLEHYTAPSRVLLLYLTSSLKIGLKTLRDDEEKTAQGLLEAAKQMSADDEAGKRLEASKQSRKWKVRLASAAGAAIIGYTGGLAAPMVAAGVGTVMGELGLGATAAAGYLGSVAGSSAVVGSLFGAYGARMTGEVMSNISAGVQDFAFLPVHGQRKEHEDSVDAATDTRRLRVIIAISGWLLEKEEVVTPWRVLKPSAEVFALRFELEALMNLGQSFDTMISSAAYGYAQSALAKRTVFSELMSAMWPMALVKVSRVVDNPFSVAKTRADKAGEVLADALINRAQGERPVTLIGYSLGARVIWACLTSLARRKAFGLVESAVLMGSPVASDISTWRAMRTAVSGRLVNVYSDKDYLLAFLYRTSSLQYGVAGLMPISGLAGIENVDVSENISGHLRYRYLVGSILQKIKFEDVDKDEVAKEAEAYKAMIEEEKKHTYVKQAKENAGSLYDQYGQRLGLPKEGRRFLEKGLSDADADKQATDMEKEVKQKTEKGLMQWAVEQLYISRPSNPPTSDVKDEANDHESVDTKSAETGTKTSDAATKSLYQRAKEATYLYRSGGAEGEDAAKDKMSQAQSDAAPAGSSSYLATAAGYIPTGYIPGFRSAGTASDGKDSSTDEAQKALGQPSIAAKQMDSSGETKSTPKNSANLQREPSDVKSDGTDASNSPETTKSNTARDGPGAERQGEDDSQAEKTADKALKAAEDADKKGSAEPFRSEDIGEESTSEAPQSADQSGEKRQEPSADTKQAADSSNKFSSYMPSFGFGSSSTETKTEQKESDPTQLKDNTEEAHEDSRSENFNVEENSGAQQSDGEAGQAQEGSGSKQQEAAKDTEEET